MCTEGAKLYRSNNNNMCKGKSQRRRKSLKLVKTNYTSILERPPMIKEWVIVLTENI